MTAALIATLNHDIDASYALRCRLAADLITDMTARLRRPVTARHAELARRLAEGAPAMVDVLEELATLLER